MIRAGIICSKQVRICKKEEEQEKNRWASASVKLTLASAFRYSPSQSGTGTTVKKNAGLHRFVPVPN
jgi:hypothetical protein